MSDTELTLDEKRCFHRDGFIVIRDAVPRELTFRARRSVNMHAARDGVHRPYHDLADDSPLPDLVNKSRLGEIMRNTMGPYDPPRSAFAAVLYPQSPTKLPNYGWQPHVDGMWYSPTCPRRPPRWTPGKHPGQATSARRTLARWARTRRRSSRIRRARCHSAASPPSSASRSTTRPRSGAATCAS